MDKFHEILHVLRDIAFNHGQFKKGLMTLEQFYIWTEEVGIKVDALVDKELEERGIEDAN